MPIKQKELSSQFNEDIEKLFLGYEKTSDKQGYLLGLRGLINDISTLRFNVSEYYERLDRMGRDLEPSIAHKGASGDCY